MKIYSSSRNAIYSCKYHIIWCPKYRVKILNNDISHFLKQTLLEICKCNNVNVLELEIVSDHVHVLLEIPPDISVSNVVKLLKGISSYKLRKKYYHLRSNKSLWSNSYFVSTVGGAPLSVVKQYISNQNPK